MAVVFIPIVAMAYYVFRKESIPKALVQTAPFLAGFAIFMAIRYAVLGFITGGEPSSELMNNAFLGLDDDQKFGTIFYTLSKYVELLIFPHTLTHDYYPYAIPVTGMSAPRAMLSVLLHIGLIGVAAWGVLKRKDIGFGVAFYLVSLVLVSNLLVNIGVFMAERFVFMPSLGFCFVVAIGLYHLCEFFNNKKAITVYKQFMPAFIALAAIFMVDCYMTFDRAKDWESNFTLFSADWKKSEGSAKIRNAMGGELTARSQDTGTKGTAKEKEMLMDAMVHLNRAAEIHPTYYSPYFLKGNAFFYLGDFEKSVENYTQSLALKSGAADTQNNLSLAAEQAGIKAGEKGQNTKAIGYFQTAVDYKPDDPKLRFFLGSANAQAGRFQEALKHLKIAEQKNTDATNFPRIHGALMQIYTSLGDTDNAAVYQRKLGQ
ncbi:MAG: tetratricopeptide repeat protein, partial [Saprospiraceae bacterium]